MLLPESKPLNGSLTFIGSSVVQLSNYSAAQFQLPFIMPHIPLYFYRNHLHQPSWLTLNPLNIPLGFCHYDFFPFHSSHLQCTPWHTTFSNPSPLLFCVFPTRKCFASGIDCGPILLITRKLQSSKKETSELQENQTNDIIFSFFPIKCSLR